MTTMMLMSAPVAGQSSGGSMQFILLLGMILVFWFFMIRPQSKKAKKQKEFINQLEKGQKVITHSGMHGTIYKVNEDTTLELEIAAGTFMKVEKSSISFELSEALRSKSESGSTK